MNVLQRVKKENEEGAIAELPSASPSVSAHSGVTNLSQLGFRTAGLNKGNLKALTNALYRIYHEYLAGIASKSRQTKTHINDQIDKVHAEMENVSAKIKQIENQDIPDAKKEVEAFNVQIEEIRIKANENFLDSDFNWVKTILFSLFSLMLGLSLVFFYTSLIYNGLFKDLNVAIQASTLDDASLLFNTLLDVKSLFTFNNSGIVLSYLFSSLFLTMGLLLHAKTINDDKWQKWRMMFTKAFLLLVALAAELIFAYKIEKNINEIKSLTLIDSPPPVTLTGVLFSVDVLIVITLGFVAYLVWSYALENAFIEWGKRNPEKLANVKIHELQRKIKRRHRVISDFNKQLVNLNSRLKIFAKKLESLKRELDMVFYQRDEVEKRFNAFFGGWLRYLNNHEDLIAEVPHHQAQYEQVCQQLLSVKKPSELKENELQSSLQYAEKQRV